MPSLTFSPTALRDLERLRAFLRAKNVQAARRATLKIIQGLQALQQHPELGRPVKDRPTDYRELVIPFGKDGYIAAYRYSGDAVVVLGVQHQRELQPSAMP